MAAKEQAIANLTALQTPEPKRRRTAQEQALAPLLKRYRALIERREEALGKVHARFDGEISGLGDAINSLGFSVDGTTLDEQAPESE